MSTLSSAREIARTEAPPFTFGRAVALLAGAVENLDGVHRIALELVDAGETIVRPLVEEGQGGWNPAFCENPAHCFGLCRQLDLEHRTLSRQCLKTRFPAA